MVILRAPTVILCATTLALTLGACASSRPQACPEGSCEIDAGVTTPDSSSPIADAAPDGPPLQGFGEGCTTNSQCDSGLCILVGTSGQCTQFCGACPDGYGCLGVEGIVIEGTVSFVCVPTSNQLCTPCTQDTECTLIGMDKCVSYADGDQACARDCSGVTCPVGYDCEDVTIGGSNFKQCMASSGACDCTAANPGAMQPCNIMTPWNVCLGAQTCAGATGWGTCEPPSAVDDPDPGFEDTNCDGIDGDRARAIFVSVAGVNSGGCGLAYSDPCQTIGFGISRAVASGRPHLYLQSGTYNTSLVMVNGISIFGGYDFNWKRGPYSLAGHTVTINGGVTAVRFDALTLPTWLDDVVIRSADATGVGASSIGVLVTNSQAVELRGVSIVSGAGTAGTPGGDGGTGGDGGDGGTGKPGQENSDGFGCAGLRPIPARGTAGSSSCSRPGGGGGYPGSAENNGNAGLNGSSSGNGGGAGGAGATCHSNRGCDGSVGGTGANGTAGPAGNGGAGFGSFTGTTYVAVGGTNGMSGTHGHGGGGGGGGGGGSEYCDSYGSSGGGGGGGGCGGGLGTGGGGGGGSFGVVANDSLVVISGSLVNGGAGGSGGRGGTGGAYGDGGGFGLGGPYGGDDEQNDGGDGARGGNGGRGGRGGDGGGGGGGPSIAVVCLGTSTSAVVALGSTLTGGTGGAGGTSAAPGTPGLSTVSSGCAF